MNRTLTRTVKSAMSWPRPRTSNGQSVCHFCDTLHEERHVREGLAARCARCGALLYENRAGSLARASAFSLAALLLMVLVHAFPFLTMDAASMRRELTLTGAAGALMKDGYQVLGVAIILFTLVAPIMLAGGMLYVCLPLLSGRAAPGAITVAKWMYRSEPWNMVEVFLLGVMVSLMKLAKVADVHFDMGFWAFFGVMLCTAAAVSGIHRHELWDRLEVART